MTHSDILVIGAGQSAMSLARSLRDLGYGGSVTLVGDEPIAPYERPPLSKSFLTDAGAQPTYFVSEPWWREQRVTLMLGETATSMDPARKTVTLQSGVQLGYGRLVIATGGGARRAAEGLTLRSEQDARLLAERLASATSVCVVGGGFLGLEIAASACGRGLKTIVLEAAPRLLPAILPPVLSQWMQDLHAQNGTTVHCNAVVASAVTAPSGRTLVSAGALTVDADCLVSAIGMVPNSALAAAAGLVVQGGIVVDERCRTSATDVYAIGDVSCTRDPGGGPPRRIESWQNAERQGAVAAADIVGCEPPAAPVPWFWTEQYGRSIQVLGSVAMGELVWRGAGTDKGFVAVNLVEGRIVGAFGVDAGKELAPLRQLIALAARANANELATGSNLRDLLAAARRQR